MRKLALLTLLLLPVLRTPVQAAPERVEKRAMSATQIADALVSRDPAFYDCGIQELLAADAATCESLGAEVNQRGVREAETILAAVGQCQTPNTLIAAFVALESDTSEVRSAAVDAMLIVPFSVSMRCGEEFLKGQRRQRLFEILTLPGELALRCDAVRLKNDGSIDDDPRTAINLALLADRFFGAPGFTGTLRGLAKVMVGSDVAYPDEIGPKPIRLPGEPDAAFNKRDRIWSANNAVRERKMEDFSIALRRRQAAEMIFRAIWVADLTQFNFVVAAGYRERDAAVTRVIKRLDAMDSQAVQLGDRNFRGMRCGDYLMELWTSDVTEFKASSYLRMRAMAGEQIALHGKGYIDAVSELNGLSRRQLADLRKNLKVWWTQYRATTEPK
jgi:hypothetical protein